MGRIRSVAVGLLVATLLCTFHSVATAQTQKAPAYETISETCGTFPNSPAYSRSDYSFAFVQAVTDKARADRANDMQTVSKIDAAMERMRTCEKKEAGKFLVLPYMDCDLFVSNFQTFEQNVGKVVTPDRELNDRIDKGRAKLAEQARQCLREMQCVDPTDTQAVLKAIHTLRVIVASGGVERVYSRSGTDFGRFLVKNDPTLYHLRFCTETDFACKGSTEFCEKRRELIMRYLEYGFRDL